jgi:hypothetical protein
MVETDRPQKALQYGACALRAVITKATDTHSEYVIFIVFLRLQWLRERFLILRLYEVLSKIFRTDALPTSTQLRATWHTDLLDMVVLPSTGALRYHNCCIDGGTSPEYFGYHLVRTLPALFHSILINGVVHGSTVLIVYTQKSFCYYQGIQISCWGGTVNPKSNILLTDYECSAFGLCNPVLCVPSLLNTNVKIRVCISQKKKLMRLRKC